jgi:hypothetical protein
MQTTSAPRLAVLGAGGVAVVLAGLVLIAVVGGKEDVCHPGPGAIRVIAESSYSGLKLAQASAPEIAPQAAQAAAESCARLSAAVASNQPESDLKLREETLTPRKPKAPDRTPQVRKLRRQADRILRESLLDPLRRTRYTEGSPLYGMILATARHVDAADAPAGCNVYISDGIAIEVLFSGIVDMRRAQATPDEQAGLRELVGHLKPLRGGVVAVLGAGGDSDLGTDRLLRAQQAFETTMKQAGITPVWSRSTDLPKRCRS